MEVTLQPEVEKLVLDRVRSGAYPTAGDLVNAAVKNLIEQERSAPDKSAKPDPKSLELALDAPANLEWIEKNGASYAMSGWPSIKDD